MIEIYRRNTNALTLASLKNLSSGELITDATVSFEVTDAAGNAVYSGTFSATGQPGGYRGIIPETVDLPLSAYGLKIEANAGPNQVLRYDEAVLVSDRPADVF